MIVFTNIICVKYVLEVGQLHQNYHKVAHNP